MAASCIVAKVLRLYLADAETPESTVSSDNKGVPSPVALLKHYTAAQAREHSLHGERAL